MLSAVYRPFGNHGDQAPLRPCRYPQNTLCSLFHPSWPGQRYRHGRSQIRTPIPAHPVTSTIPAIHERKKHVIEPRTVQRNIPAFGQSGLHDCNLPRLPYSFRLQIGFDIVDSTRQVGHLEIRVLMWPPLTITTQRNAHHASTAFYLSLLVASMGVVIHMTASASVRRGGVVLTAWFLVCILSNQLLLYD